jgi:hypothetical protein
MPHRRRAILGSAVTEDLFEACPLIVKGPTLTTADLLDVLPPGSGLGHGFSEFV